jgi:hypothetical protein
VYLGFGGRVVVGDGSQLSLHKVVVNRLRFGLAAWEVYRAACRRLLPAYMADVTMQQVCASVLWWGAIQSMQHLAHLVELIRLI